MYDEHGLRKFILIKHARVHLVRKELAHYAEMMLWWSDGRVKMKLSTPFLLLQLLWTRTPPCSASTAQASASAWTRWRVFCPHARAWTPRCARGCSATWPTAWPSWTPWTTRRKHTPHPRLLRPSVSQWCRSPARRTCPFRCRRVRARRHPACRRPTLPRCTAASSSSRPQTDSLPSWYPAARSPPAARWSRCTRAAQPRLSQQPPRLRARRRSLQTPSGGLGR